jgi:hypothetical protein
MTRKLNHWGYYVMATRESAYPPSRRWRIVRRGKPMGVRIEGGGFTTYEAARMAGRAFAPMRAEMAFTLGCFTAESSDFSFNGKNRTRWQRNQKPTPNSKT